MPATMESVLRGIFEVLEAAGFTRVGRAQLATRVGDGVLHHLSAAQRGAWFQIEFAAQPLWVPEENLVLQPGGSITSKPTARGKAASARVCQPGYLRGEPSIPGATIEPGNIWPLDERSVEPIVACLRSTVLPWLDRARDAAGMLAVLEKETWASYHHQDFARTLALARLDRLDDARAAAESAISGYAEDLAERPHVTWCAERIARCRELVAALDDRTHQALLARWAATTLAAITS